MVPAKSSGVDPVGVDLADQLLVGEHEGPEVEGVGVLHARHEERPRAVVLLHVDGQAEPHVRVPDDPGCALAVDVGDEAGVERRHLDERADDGVADQVGEADLGSRGPGQLVVEDLAVDLEQAGREPSGRSSRSARRGWPPCWRRSVDAAPRSGTAAASGARAVAVRCRCGGGGNGGRRHGLGRRWRFDGLGPGRRPRGGRDRGRAVVGEELPPALAHRSGVGDEALVHVVDEPGVRPEGPATSPPRMPRRRSRRAPYSSRQPWVHPTGVGSLAIATRDDDDELVAAAGSPGIVPTRELPGRTLRDRPARRCRGTWTTSRSESARVVVLVHGTLDRGNSFRRTMRRLEDVRVVTYDRRGYQDSRGAEPPVGVEGHIEDLLGILAEVGGRSVVVGHSLGGAVAIGAALAEPERFAALGAFEPPISWLPVEGRDARGAIAPDLGPRRRRRDVLPRPGRRRRLGPPRTGRPGRPAGRRTGARGRPRPRCTASRSST